MSNRRTELQREVVDALVQSKAFDFEAIGNVLGKYGARAALTGDSIGVVINWRVLHYCIPPVIADRVAVIEAEQIAASTVEERSRIFGQPGAAQSTVLPLAGLVRKNPPD
jgi:hypothetical protein